MLQYLDTREVGSHCQRGGPVDHWALLEQRALASALRPLAYLPIFELCHRLYFETRKGRMDPRIFAACYQQFCVAHEEVAALSDGHLIWLSHELPATLQSPFWPHLAELPPRRPLKPGEGPRDPREYDDDYLAHCERMRAVSQGQFETLDGHLLEEPTNLLAWSGPAPEPAQDLQKAWNSLRSPPPSPCMDLVLDSNVAIELLAALAPDGSFAALPILGDRRVAEACTARLRQSIDSCGKQGRILLPLTVLEESHHHGQHQSGRYPRLLANLQDIHNQQQRSHSEPHWTDAFDFEEPSFDVLAALFGLLTELCPSLSRDPETGRLLGLPTFTDCMVVAHGLVHGCWVASAEWTAKTDWHGVSALYRWLVPSP